jgi:hypothetical protein
VRIIVGWAAGGGSDIAARLIGQWLSERLGQQFIVENRQGGSGSIATESVVRAQPDGYMLLLADANATFFERLTAGKVPLAALTQRLAELGWADGRNVRTDLRWGGDDINLIRALAQELVGLQPDIIVTGSTPANVALQRETLTIPIVFENVADPVASGIVARLDRPSGNITGFAAFEASLGGKWLELPLGDRARGQAGGNHVQSRHRSRIRSFALD